MEIKHCTEKFIQDAGLDYLIIRLCGFMQVNVFLLWGSIYLARKLICFRI